MADYIPTFIGREEAISIFRGIVERFPRKNALYIEANGGLGKTWLLREYIENHCKNPWRSWYIHSDDQEWESTNLVIDFYQLENRTISGLRRSIASRIGKNHFPNFFDANNNNNETAANYWFFTELLQARKKISNYIVLFFDTFETVCNGRTGRWFLDEFLLNTATQGYFIVFAGRPRDFKLHEKVYPYRLPPFDKTEMQSYFQQKFKTDIGPVENAIIEICEGQPLIIDLLVHYGQTHNIPFEDFLTSIHNFSELEQSLVARFVLDSSPEGELIRSLAYLTKRYNKEIFVASGLQDDYDAIKSKVKTYPFIKHRPGQYELTLHDEFQRMFTKYGGYDFIVSKQALQKKIVQEWYPQKIQTETDPTMRYLLEAEQLTYLLDVDFDYGLKFYYQRWEEIKKNNEYERFNILWGELDGYLANRNDRSSFDLYQETANWLFTDQSRQANAAYWFEQLVDNRFKDVCKFEETARNYIRLGHYYLRTTRLEDAEILWGEGLQLSKQQTNKEVALFWEATFIYNLGHIANRRERWNEAIEQYNQTISIARKIKNHDIYAEASYVSAALYAILGNAAEARKRAESAKKLLDENVQENNTIPYAIALIYIADTYRYLEDNIKAQLWYKQAYKILTSKNTGFAWQVRAITGEAATYVRIAKSTPESEPYVAHENLSKAWDLYKQGLQIIRIHILNEVLFRLFDRMIPFYQQLAKWEKLQQDNPTLIAISQSANELDLPEEMPYLDQFVFENKRFSELDSSLARAQRLGELAFYLANESGLINFALDALVQAANSAVLQERYEDLRSYRRRVITLRALGDDLREQFFQSFFDLLETYSLFEKDIPKSISQMADAATKIANFAGTGPYFLKMQLDTLQKILYGLDQNYKLEYFPQLVKSWKSQPSPLFELANELEDYLYWHQ